MILGLLKLNLIIKTLRVLRLSFCFLIRVGPYYYPKCAIFKFSEAVLFIIILFITVTGKQLELFQYLHCFKNHYLVALQNLLAFYKKTAVA